MTKKKIKKPSKSQQDVSKSILSIFSRHPTRAFNHKQILKLLRQHEPLLASKVFYLDDKEANRRIILEALSVLKESDDLVEIDPGRFKLVPTQMFLEGIIQTTSTGAGYVINENHEEDIYISPSNTGFAFDGDFVKILLFAKKPRRRQEGEVTEVLNRARTDFAGTVNIQNKQAWLVPDSHRVNVEINIPEQKLNGAKNGEKVVVKIIKWPDDLNNAQGEILSVLGMPGENDAEMHSILIEYGFPSKFDQNIEDEADRIDTKITGAIIKKRTDFRNVTTFTIDPLDAKDFDDALSVEIINEDKYKIGIHIADVTHYIKPGTELDNEAYNRATSIYLVDRVVPMLPEKLSNQVCSLRPGEDKLCFSAVFTIDINGNVQEEWFGKTVINSDRRFTYEEAQKILEQKKGAFSKELLSLDGIAKKLRTQRFKKGAISFEREEIKFKLDENGNPVGVYAKANKDSNKLIEEFMLLANRSVAEFIGKGSSTPNKAVKPPVFVYRIHDSPVPEKLNTFAGFAGRFGYKLVTNGEKEIAKSLNNLLDKVKGKAEQNVIEQLAIRTMSKAVYTTENIGHYGLAFDYYTHFTSPIRRYPDVLVHRLLEHYLNGGKSVKEDDYEELCDHSTDMEIKASEAERASIKYKQVQYLQDKKGEKFQGIISGVTERGFFVELKDNKCEGMVRLRDIPDDYYEYDESSYAIYGHRTGATYRLGDAIEVLVKKTDLEKKQIDFVLSTGLTLSKPKKDKGRKQKHESRLKRKKKRKH